MITTIIIIAIIVGVFCFTKNNKKKVAKIEEVAKQVKEEIKKKVKK